MINEIKKEAEVHMKNAVSALAVALSKLRTGRAHPALLDGIMVSYYGAATPLNQVANVSVEDGRTLSIIPWEKSLVPEIEKAIMKSDLGLNPVTAGENIRVPMPALTEETRKDLIKHARAEAESARVSVRNARRDANSSLKELVKEKEIGEDDARRGEEDVQKLTDRFIHEVDEVLKQKESDLMVI